MSYEEKIKLQNKLRAKKYYDNHKQLISERRKASRNNQPVVEKVVEVPMITKNEKQIIKELQTGLNTLNQEIKNIKKQKENKTKVDEIQQEKNYTYNLKECIDIINAKIDNENSKKNYISNIKTIYDILRKDSEDVNNINLFTKLKNFKNVVHRLYTVQQSKKNEKYSTNSIKGFIQTILKVKDLYDMPLSDNAKEFYKQEFEKIKLSSNIETEKKLTTETVMDFNEYLDKIKNYYGVDSKPYLIVTFYKIAGFRDDISFYVVNKTPKIIDKNINYLVVPENANKRMSILLNQYKTVNKYGQKVIDIKKEDSKLIRNYINKNKIEYNSYLFKGPQSQTIANFNKPLGLKIGINKIRKMIVSTALENDDNVYDVNERIKLAQKMNHNPATSTKTYKHTIQK